VAHNSVTATQDAHDETGELSIPYATAIAHARNPLQRIDFRRNLQVRKPREAVCKDKKWPQAANFSTRQLIFSQEWAIPSRQ